MVLRLLLELCRLTPPVDFHLLSDLAGLRNSCWRSIKNFLIYFALKIYVNVTKTCQYYFNLSVNLRVIR